MGNNARECRSKFRSRGRLRDGTPEYKDRKPGQVIRANEPLSGLQLSGSLSDMATFTKVASLDDVPEGQGVGLGIGRKRIVLFNIEGELLAVEATCAQHGAPLNRGVIHEGNLQCPWHGVAFDVRRGIRRALSHDLPGQSRRDRHTASDLLLLRLNQEATISSVPPCPVRRSRLVSANSSSSSLTKQPAGSTWRPVHGPAGFDVRAARVGERTLCANGIGANAPSADIPPGVIGRGYAALVSLRRGLMKDRGKQDRTP